MDQRMSIVTLGVASVERSRAFYERLGWTASGASQDEIAFFQLNGMVLALHPRHKLAEDARVEAAGGGFAGVTLAQNYASPAEVDVAFTAAVAAGAAALKPPETVYWGGYSGTVGDPDGYCWELAHNPFFALDAAKNLILPP